MNISVGALVLMLIACLAVGVLGGYVLAVARSAVRLEQVRRSEADAAARASAAEARAEELTKQLSHMQERAQHDTNVMQILNPLNSTLTRMSDRVNDIEERRAAQLAEVQAQLRTSKESDEKLAAATQGLNEALRNDRTRGQWGEAQLARILEMSGMDQHISFDTQVSLSGADGERVRPDVVVALPGGHQIVIDAKVPMSSYLEASSMSPADDDSAARQTTLLAAHAMATRQHIDVLAKANYPSFTSSSPPVTVMFMPSEALLSAALHEDPTLLEYALSKGVVMASPASLLALLHSMSSVLRLQRASDDAKALLEVGDELVSRLATVVDHMSKLGRSIGSTVENYNRAVGSVESRLLVTMRRVTDQADSISIDQLEGSRAHVHEFTRAELQNFGNDDDVNTTQAG